MSICHIGGNWRLLHHRYLRDNTVLVRLPAVRANVSVSRSRVTERDNPNGHIVACELSDDDVLKNIEK